MHLRYCAKTAHFKEKMLCFTFLSNISARFLRMHQSFALNVGHVLFVVVF